MEKCFVKFSIVGSINSQELILRDASIVKTTQIPPDSIDEGILLILSQVECTKPSRFFEVILPFDFGGTASELISELAIVDSRIIIRIKQVLILEPLWIRLFEKDCLCCSHEGREH